MRCVSCQSDNPPQFHFCGTCGASLTSVVRCQLTVMFCEVVGATSLFARLDPEDFHDILSIYQETCAVIVRRYSGYIARQVSDTLLVYFGYPKPYSDAPQHAVQAGLALLAALPGLNARLQNAPVPPLASLLQLRIGIHTGVAVVGEMGNKDYTESTALGETPNIAARLMTLADANTLVIGAHTYHLIQHQFMCLSRGPHRLKGIATPMPVYHVVAARDGESGG